MRNRWKAWARVDAERRALLVTTTIVAVALLLVGLAQTSPGRSLTEKLGVAAPSEPFTALFFANPAALPATAPRRFNSEPVSFVIENAEHKTMTYGWSVSVAQTRSIVSGRTTLDAGERVTVTRSILVACPPRTGGPAQRRRVQVSLSAPRESIGYWLVCDN